MRPASRIPAPLVESAAERLVNVPPRSRRAAARQLIEAAPAHGIDLSMLWGVLDTNTPLPRVAQVCLLVPTPGRTAVVYLSGMDDATHAADPATQHLERVSCLQAAFRDVDRELAGEIALCQSLVSPQESTTLAACLEAGMFEVADLEYLRRRLDVKHEIKGVEDLPAGVTVRLAGDMTDPHMRDALGKALERSYVDTRDCPALCGLRRTADVIQSHLSTGQHDPALWWVVELDGEPEGALLLSPFPEQGLVELVYVGWSPPLRERGLGRILMSRAIEAAREYGAAEMTCAVDVRNDPALALYERFGFAKADRRHALVRPTGAAAT
jgi:ribosomal protein S18 acetylase RimI-like enzyme